MVAGRARALLTARFQVLWNLAHRGKSASAAVAALIIAGLAVVCLVPPFFMFWTFGNVLGEDIAAPGSPSLVWLCGLQALLTLGLGAMAGLRHRSGFERELLRAFPMKPAHVLLADLPFNLLDTIAVIGTTMFVGLGGGLAASAPSAWPHAVLLAVQGVAGLVLVQQLVGSARRLASRSRALMLVAGLLVIAITCFAMLGASAGSGFASVLGWLPTSAGDVAFQAAARGDASHAWLMQGVGLAFLAALFLVTTWMQFAELEQDPPLRSASSGAHKTWTFAKPHEGVMRLFVSQVTGSRAGKLLLLLPLFCTFMIVLAADILRRSAEGRDPTGFHLSVQEFFARLAELPVYVIVPVAVMLFNRNLWMNQFAWNGAGVKTLLLLPLRTRDLLRGLLFGLILVQLPQAMVASAPLFRMRMPREWELMTGFSAAAFCACVLATVGHVFSAMEPRVMGDQGERAGGLPPWLNLFSSLLVVGLATIVYASLLFVAPMALWGPPAMFVALTVAVLILHDRVIGQLARVVEAHRETLAETLG